MFEGIKTLLPKLINHILWENILSYLATNCKTSK